MGFDVPEDLPQSLGVEGIGQVMIVRKNGDGAVDHHLIRKRGGVMEEIDMGMGIKIPGNKVIPSHINHLRSQPTIVFEGPT